MSVPPGYSSPDLLIFKAQQPKVIPKVLKTASNKQTKGLLPSFSCHIFFTHLLQHNTALFTGTIYSFFFK